MNRHAGTAALEDWSEWEKPVFQAFWLMRIVFTVAPIVFGLDRFAHALVDWNRCLAPEFVGLCPEPPIS